MDLEISVDFENLHIRGTEIYYLFGVPGCVEKIINLTVTKRMKSFYESITYHRFLISLLVCLVLAPGMAAGEKPQHIRIAVKEFPPLVMAETKGLCIDMATIICERNGLVPEFVFYNNVPEFLTAVEKKRHRHRFCRGNHYSRA